MNAPDSHHHGAHWAPFVDDPVVLVERLSRIVPNALEPSGYGTRHRPPPSLGPEGSQLVWPTRTQGLSLVLFRTGGEQEHVSMFPFFATGTKHRITLDILVTQRAWRGSKPPKTVSDIEGELWLQGYLWDRAIAANVPHA